MSKLLTGTMFRQKFFHKTKEEHGGISTDILASFGGEIFLFATSFLLGVLTARYLGADGKGRFNVVFYAVSLLSTIFSLRFQRATTYYLSKHKDMLGESIAISMLVGLVSTILVIIASIIFHEFFYSTLIKGIEVEWEILALISASTYLWGIIIALYAGLQLFRQRALFMGVSYLLKSALVILALGFLKGDLNDLFLAMGTVETVAYILVIASLLPGLKSLTIHLKPLQEMLRYSLAAFPGMLSDIVTLRIDVFFINFFAGASQVGIYTVAISIANMFLYIPTAARSVLMPYIAGQGNREITPRLSRLILLTLVGLSVFLIPIVWIFLLPIYGEQFAYSRVLFLILLPGTIFWGIFALISSDIEGRGMPLKVSYISMLCAISTVILDLLLIPSLAATGAAITSSITYGMAMILVIFLYSRETGTRPLEVIAPQKEDFQLLFSVVSRSINRFFPSRVGMMARSSVEMKRVERIVIILPSLIHYQYPRLQMLSNVCAQAGIAFTNIELSSYVKAYPWLSNQPQNGFQNLTLFPDQYLDNIPMKELWPALNEQLEKLQPDVLFLYGYSLGIFRKAQRWAKKNGVATVLISDSNYFDKKRHRIFEWLKSFLVAPFDAAFVGGTSSSQYLQTLGFPPKRIAYGFDVIDTAFFDERSSACRESLPAIRQKWNLPENYFLFVGRLIPEKNLLFMLNAYKEYAVSPLRKHEAWDLVLCGSGIEEVRVKEFAASLPEEICQKIHLYGHIQQPELIEIFSAANSLLLASISESWGLVVNEAMACHLPVLVTNRAGCAQDLVINGRNGWSFDPYNGEELQQRMMDITNLDLSLRKQMGEQGYRLISNWGLDRFSQGVLESARIAYNHRQKTGMKTVQKI
jgi:1,2-diacylglycerol 3-alpha-glucosyltransferase